MSDKADFDAVSLGIMWDRLVSITDEILSALVRSSFSTIVRESYDLSVILLDAEGNSLAQGSYSVPSFTGTAAATLRHMLAKFPPETLSPGDVIATNDAWMGTGHLYDVNVARPVFKGDRIVGYTMSITHLPDIGGPGFGTSATEIYHEGIRLPISKLVEGGRINELLIEVIRNNVRVPEQVFGDLMANITCNEVGGRQVLEFLDEYGLADLKGLSRAVRGQAEQAIREKIRAMPDGVYENAIQLEGIDDPLTLACRIEVRGDDVALDFDGTSPAVARGINVPLCYTRAMSLYAVKCLTVPEMPNNEGATAPISLTAPEGSILNAQPPSPTGGRHIIGHFVVPLVFGALAEVAPQMVQADCGLMNTVTFQGVHQNGRPLSTLYFASGGFGALAGQDGAETRPGPSNMGVVPVEMWESLTSTTILKKHLLPDSGGPGASRGGLGQEVHFRNDTGTDMTLFCMAARTEFPALGLLGGEAGGKRRISLNDEAVHPKGTHTLPPGGRFTMREAGGGGFGAPAERPRALVQTDLERGLITPEGAARDYGLGSAAAD
ncbi:MAG: hydantoinase B/oxoprolinase family protein [Alphaproteobacteria bacterium]|jgi:N-methylhydantoinase B|nr:hydantoinase B/oxoprolinase family protein [Alphaproteobacteria bacterium]